MKLKNSHTMLFGLKGSGKSNWLQYVLREHADKYRSHLLYDVCREHAEVPGGRYIPTHRRGDDGRDELDRVLGALVTDADRDRRPELVAVEEVSRFCSARSPPPAALYDLIDLNRHLGVGLIGVARRPAQVHADLVELADNLIIYRLTGKNDYRRLEEEVEGLGDAVRGLSEYQYVLVGPDRHYQVHAPVPEMNSTGRL